MKLLTKLQNLITDFLFPLECLACGQAGFLLCPACFQQLKFRQQQICLFCEKTRPAGLSCLDCRSNYYLDGVFIAGDYEDPILANLIKKFKFYGIKGLSEVLGNFIIAALNDYEASWPEFLEEMFPQVKRYSAINNFINSKTLLIPIPISRRRRAQRGYNQSELLAQVLLRKIPHSAYSESLKKIRHTRAQSSLKADERFNNLTNSFSWQGESLAGTKILLIDDIATTGAALAEAAKTLKAAGAEKIWGLVLAKG